MCQKKKLVYSEKNVVLQSFPSSKFLCLRSYSFFSLKKKRMRRLALNGESGNHVELEVSEDCTVSSLLETLSSMAFCFSSPLFIFDGARLLSKSLCIGQLPQSTLSVRGGFGDAGCADLFVDTLVWVPVSHGALDAVTHACSNWRRQSSCLKDWCNAAYVSKSGCDLRAHHAITKVTLTCQTSENVVAKIAALPRVQELALRHIPASILPLTASRTIERLSFCRLMIDDSVITEIAQIVGLKYVDFSGCKGAGRRPWQLDLLRSLPFLRVLVLSDTDVLPRAVVDAASLSVEELHLERCKALRDVGSQLASMVSLRRLYVDGVTMWYPAIGNLAKIPRLEMLSLDYCSFGGLSDLSGAFLRELHASHTDITPSILRDVVRRANQLEVLVLKGCQWLDNVNALRDLPCLKYLDIGGCPINVVPEMPLLEELHVECARSCLVPRLGHLKSLRRLFADSTRLSSEDVLAVLQSCQALELFSIKKCVPSRVLLPHESRCKVIQ